MTVLRWIAFIPVAFTTSLAAGLVGHWFGNFFVVRYLDLGNIGLATAWIVSGLGSGLAFIFISMKVAPVRNSKVKSTLVVIPFILGAISAIGSFLAGDEQSVAFAGIVMVLVAIGAARMQPDQLII